MHHVKSSEHIYTLNKFSSLFNPIENLKIDQQFNLNLKISNFEIQN